MLSRTNFNIDDLRFFHYVVTEGSFNKASLATNTTPARISRAIARLEEAFGASLLYSDRRTINLTPEGKSVLLVANTMMEIMNRCHVDIAAEHQEMSGPIALSASAGFGNHWLLPTLRPFLKDHPGIFLDFKIDAPEEANLILGATDIQITSAKPEPRESLAHHLLCVYPLYIYASPSYLASYGIPHYAKDLDHHKIIGWQQGPHRYVDEILFNTLLYVGRPSRRARTPVLRIDGDLSLISAAREGIGLALMPPFFADQYPDLQRIKLKDEETFLSQRSHRKYIVYHKMLDQSARHKAMIDLIRTAGSKLHHKLLA